MKFLIALVALFSLALATPSFAAPVPDSVKAEVAAALANPNASTPEAMAEAIAAIIKENPELAAEITALAVQTLGASMTGAAAVAAISAVVAEAVKAAPTSAAAITAAALTALPESLKETAGPALVAAAVEAAPASQKAAVLNSAIQAAQGDTTLIAAITQIAADEGIPTNPDGTFADAPPTDTGDPGVGTEGQTGPAPSSGSGGGAGGGPGTTSTAAPTPAS